jgi:hypothetical protein
VLALAAARGYREYVGMGTLLQSWAAARDGQSEAAAVAPAVLGAIRQAGLGMLVHYFLWLEADGLLARDRPADAERVAVDGIRVSTATGEAFALPGLHLARAAALRALGRTGDAATAVDAARCEADRLRLVPWQNRASRAAEA